MSQLNERGANSERNSALWGTGGRGGDRSSVLWGKGGRGMLVATMVVALAAPLAATASKGKPVVPPAPVLPVTTSSGSDQAPQGDKSNTPDGKSWVAGDLLNKANELIKKDAGINLQSLSNREKTQLVDALKQTYPVLELLETLGLARSSYFYHRIRLQVADKHADVRHAMAEKRSSKIVFDFAR